MLTHLSKHFLGDHANPVLRHFSCLKPDLEGSCIISKFHLNTETVYIFTPIIKQEEHNTVAPVHNHHLAQRNMVPDSRYIVLL